jgi:hypothetical protein
MKKEGKKENGSEEKKKEVRKNEMKAMKRKKEKNVVRNSIMRVRKGQTGEEEKDKKMDCKISGRLHHTKDEWRR